MKTMTVAEVVKQYGIGRTKLYELIAENRIEAVKLGTRTLIVVDSVNGFIASLPKLRTA